MAKPRADTPQGMLFASYVRTGNGTQICGGEICSIVEALQISI
jgi:hypothetical protein